MPTPTTGRPFSELNQVNDLRGDDFVPILRPSEPLLDDKNAIISGARLLEIFDGNSTTPPGPSIPLYAGLGAHTDGPIHQAGATALFNRGPNDRSGVQKVVRFLTDDEVADDGLGGSSLESLDKTKIGLFDEVIVEDYRITGQPQVYKQVLVAVFDDGLSYTNLPDYRRFVGGRDGRFASTQTLALVEADSAAAARGNTRQWNALIDNFLTNELITAMVGGAERFFRVLTGGGPYPIPAGGTDAYYREVAPPVPQQSTFQQLTQLQAVGMLDDFAVGRNRLYLITIGSQQVYVQGMADGTFSGPGQLIDPTNSERTIPVTVDVRSGTIVNIQAQLEALASPFYSPDQSDTSKLKGYFSLEDAFDATNGGDSYIVVLSQPIVLLLNDTTLADVTVYGRQQLIRLAAGKTLHFDGGLRLDDVSLDVSLGTTDWAPLQMRGQSLSGTFPLRSSIHRFYDVDLSQAHFTGLGDLYLYDDTTDPASVAVGVIVHDLRGSGGSAGPARLQIVSAQGQRVAVLAIESNAVQFSDVRLFDHAAALNFQVNTRVSGNWVPGVQQTLTQLNATIASLTSQQLSDGVEVEFETQVSGAVASQFVAAITASGLSGFSTLPGTRAARRVNNPNTSPEPAVGFTFNSGGATMQSFSIPNPAVSEACLVFWLKRNTPAGSGAEYWLASGRTANEVYFTADSAQGLTAYVESVVRGNSLLGSPQGQWVRVAINFSALAAGTVNLFTGNPGTGSGPVNCEVYDVRLYSRQLTGPEIADRTAAPTDSLLARYTFPFNLDTSTGTVPDESGNNRTGTLYNF